MNNIQKKKVREQLDKLFGKNLPPEREEFKLKVYRGLVGEYTQDDVDAAEREFQEMKQMYLDEMVYTDHSPATESEVIVGKIMSADGIDVTVTDNRPEHNAAHT